MTTYHANTTVPLTVEFTIGDDGTVEIVAVVVIDDAELDLSDVDAVTVAGGFTAAPTSAVAVAESIFDGSLDIDWPAWQFGF